MQLPIPIDSNKGSVETCAPAYTLSNMKSFTPFLVVDTLPLPGTSYTCAASTSWSPAHKNYGSASAKLTLSLTTQIQHTANFKHKNNTVLKGLNISIQASSHQAQSYPCCHSHHQGYLP